MSEHFPVSADTVPADSPGRKTVGQMMRPTTAIELGAHLAAAAYLLKHHQDTALVVLTEDTQEPVATITDAEITRAISDGRDLENTHVSEVVTAKPVTVGTDLPAEDAVRLMLSQGVQRLPVAEGRQLVGIVELADLGMPAPPI
jgi:CBS domain-containing protein